MTVLKKLYLDTSVISAYFDYKKPIRQLITEKWFKKQAKLYSLYISYLVLDEIEATKNTVLRSNMVELVQNEKMAILLMNESIINLADEYRRQIIPDEINDSLHIAIASYYGLDAIVSWNFKHIVNLDTIKGIHRVNQMNSKEIVEIVSLENIGGDDFYVV